MSLRRIVLTWSSAVVGTASFVITVWASPACPIKPVELAMTGAQSGGLTIELSDGVRLGEHDGAERAMVWDEPMKLHQNSGAVCTVDRRVGIITPPLFDAGGRVLYVTTYSGSHSVLFAVDATNCNVLWASPAFVDRPMLVGREFVLSHAPAVTVGDDCLPVDRPAR
jgi:outer membrane protein assembly factor BamB